MQKYNYIFIYTLGIFSCNLFGITNIFLDLDELIT